MKLLLVLLAVVACASAFETCGKKGSGDRIVNGLPAGHGEFPWQISLQYNPSDRYYRQHICGGEGVVWGCCSRRCLMVWILAGGVVHLEICSCK